MFWIHILKAPMQHVFKPSIVLLVTVYELMYYVITLLNLHVVSPVGSLMATPTINSSVNATELLNCTAMGGPGNRFEWQRMSMSLGFTEQINVTIVSAASGGDYQCIVSNRAGNDTIVTIVNGEF